MQVDNEQLQQVLYVWLIAMVRFEYEHNTFSHLKTVKLLSVENKQGCQFFLHVCVYVININQTTCTHACTFYYQVTSNGLYNIIMYKYTLKEHACAC